MNDARSRLASLAVSEPKAELRPPPVPSLETLDKAILPDFRNRYQELVPTLAERNTDVVVMERSDKLTDLVDKAFDTLNECLDLNDPNPDFVRMMSLRKDTALGVLNTQAKVDDTSLRRRQTDMLPKLLEIIAREEKYLPVTIEG